MILLRILNSIAKAIGDMIDSLHRSPSDTLINCGGRHTRLLQPHFCVGTGVRFRFFEVPHLL